MDRFFRENDIHLKMEEGDEALLKEYACDFVSFSYYSSSIATVQEDGQQTAGNLVVSTKNPYLKESDWGWQIDQLVLELCSIKCMIVLKNNFYFRKRLRSKRSIK